MWSEAKDLIMLTTVAAEGGFTHEQGSRECGCAWQNIDCSYVQSVMKNVHGALLYPRQNNLPSQ